MCTGLFLMFLGAFESPIGCASNAFGITSKVLSFARRKHIKNSKSYSRFTTVTGISYLHFSNFKN